MVLCSVYQPPTPDDPDQPVRPRLRAGLSNLQRSSAAAAAGAAAAGAAAATAAAVGSSSSFTSSPGPGGGAGGAASTAASPGQLPPATARPGTAIQMTQVSSPATGGWAVFKFRGLVHSRGILRHGSCLGCSWCLAQLPVIWVKVVVAWTVRGAICKKGTELVSTAGSLEQCAQIVVW